MAGLREPRQPREPRGRGDRGPLLVVTTEDPRRGQSRLPVWREGTGGPCASPGGSTWTLSPSLILRSYIQLSLLYRPGYHEEDIIAPKPIWSRRKWPNIIWLKTS